MSQFVEDRIRLSHSVGDYIRTTEPTSPSTIEATTAGLSELGPNGLASNSQLQKNLKRILAFERDVIRPPYHMRPAHYPFDGLPDWRGGVREGIVPPRTSEPYLRLKMGFPQQWAWPRCSAF
ncbi:hypothetical protein ACLOJK_030422 [Asimina triloba]